MSNRRERTAQYVTVSSAEFTSMTQGSTAPHPCSASGDNTEQSLTIAQRNYLPFKRLIDIIFSLIALIVLSPFFLIIAIIIKLDSPGPVFFKIENRVGRGGKIISYYKFRSMTQNAAELQDSLRSLNEMDGPVFKITDDPRMTRTGRFIRKYSIDELPQIFSVLTGRLSIVGPRPLAVYEVSGCSEEQRIKRQSVRPGLTCFWQVMGRSKIKSFSQWMKLDMLYIDKMSLSTDFGLIFRTIPVVLLGRGAV